jgi:hypothetical protein
MTIRPCYQPDDRAGHGLSSRQYILVTDPASPSIFLLMTPTKAVVRVSVTTALQADDIGMRSGATTVAIPITDLALVIYATSKLQPARLALTAKLLLSALHIDKS